MATTKKNASNPKVSVKQPVSEPELNDADVFIPEELEAQAVEPEIQLAGETKDVKQNEFMEQVLLNSAKPRTKGNWVAMTSDEVKQYQIEKRLIGYDPVKKQGLLKG